MIINERITAYINTLEKELPLHLYELEREANVEGVPIIKKDTQTFLRFLLALHKPSAILEVGAAVGFSALYMAEYMPVGCSITTIEKVEQRIIKAKENFKRAPLGKDITLLEGDALQILKQLTHKPEKEYDFIFMDAAKAQYLNFLPEIMKLLKTGGILVTDNVLQDGTVAESRYGITRRDRTIHSRMREYLYTITHLDELETAVLPVGDGVTVSTKLKPQTL